MAAEVRPIAAARPSAAPAPGESRRWALIAFAAFAVVGVAVHGLHALAGPGSSVADRLVDDWLYAALFLATAGSLALRARRDRALRVPWTIAAIGVAIWAAAEVSYRVLEPSPSATYPPLTQALLGLSFLCAGATLLLLGRQRIGRLHLGLTLDGLIAGVAVCAFAAALLFPAAAAEAQASPPTLFLMADLAILAYVVMSLGLTGWRPGICWGLICAGIVANTAGNIALVQLSATGDFSRGTVVDTLYVASALLLGAASWQPFTTDLAARFAGSRTLLAPSAFALAALGLLVVGATVSISPVAVGLAALSLVLLLARTTMAFAENRGLLEASRRDALTDGLTGLGNRRRLVRDLTAAAARAEAEPATLVLFDLDGFKHYNDTFGHPAGDALLARLASRFAEAVGPRSSYRAGGDEFCALLPIPGPRAARAIAAAAGALAESGDGFSVTASWGAVGMPDEAVEAEAAMQLADQRMYRQKDSRRASPIQQSRAVLLQVLNEREPGLSDHQAEVAELSVAVGRQLGVAADDLRDLGRAAELHDVGKIAVPDAILHKAGPLDESEFDFIRQHTVIGERILAAAPALAGAARLVRASHERWDGRGYPDGTAGERIPLGARIIAVCDAYSAMTSARPYSAAMDGDAALAELEACAGSQFDPDVVAAFSACRDIVAPGATVTALRVS
ncbi:MAG: diguanylate cyclase [Solirubrobacteraceae bacterium]